MYDENSSGFPGGAPASPNHSPTKKFREDQSDIFVGCRPDNRARKTVKLSSR